MKIPARTINVSDIAEKETSLAKEIFAPISGMKLTMSRMVQNLTGQVSPTINYPEERRSYSNRYRGAHILTAREDGTPRCVACYMCATACPADCIYIEAKEHPDPLIEKQASRFEIDMLRCVFCGFCVDACPEEAIIMSRETEISAFSRGETMWDLMRLMERPELKEFGLGYRPNETLVESTIKFVPKDIVQIKMAGRITLKEEVEMIPNITFKVTDDKK